MTFAAALEVLVTAAQARLAGDVLGHQEKARIEQALERSVEPMSVLRVTAARMDEADRIHRDNNVAPPA